MKNLKASDVMTRPVMTSRPNASARDVVLQLASGVYSGMPVTEGDGKVVGILTEFDLLHAVSVGKELVKTTAEEIMCREVTTVGPDTPVSEIIEIMRDKNIIRVPVVKEEKLVGIVSRSDILRNLIEPEFTTYF
ncbi:MAG: CBS domain-containing protein [Nitrospinales bacterium]